MRTFIAWITGGAYYADKAVGPRTQNFKGQRHPSIHRAGNRRPDLWHPLGGKVTGIARLVDIFKELTTQVLER